MNNNQKILSTKLHDLLVQEIDIENSGVNKFLENTALNIILKTLSYEKRVIFYKLLRDDKEAASFIESEIPDFNERMMKIVKKKFKEVP